MAIALTDTPLNIGTSSVLALPTNQLRKALVIMNKHASQTCTVKFGAAVVATDVVQQQTISFSSVPDNVGGTWELSYNGNPTAALAYNIIASALQTALRLVTGLGSVTVTGSISAGFVVTMTGATPNTNPNFPLFVVAQNSLTTVSVPVVITPTISTAGAYADGYIIPALGVLSFTGGSCPIDAVYALASGSNTRVDFFQG